MRPLRMVLLLGVTIAALPAERRELMVAMRDGVRLATDIYLPAGPGKFPVLLARSPYNKNGERRRGEFFADHGYVFVAQDCRGTGKSEGILYPLTGEGKDGYDAIEWCARQPWSNGAVGTVGASYLAMNQYAAAIERPPHLAAMYAAVGSENFYYDSAWRGGIASLSWPLWMVHEAATSPRAAEHANWKRELDAVEKQPEDWLKLSRSQREELLRNFPDELRMYRDFYAHPGFDAYWKQKGFDFADYYSEMKKVPVYFVSGWYDSYAAATVRNYAALRGSIDARLMMGPWPHGYGKRQCGDADFGPEAQLDEPALQLDWFDHWLRGRNFQVIGTEPVRYFRMQGRSGGEWRTAANWPPGTGAHRYYLAEDGRLESASGAGGQAIVEHDPARPVRASGGRHGNTCVQNQAGGPGVIQFATAPLEKPVEITGNVQARLYAQPQAGSADFVVTLVDVDADGYGMPVADGAVRVTRAGEATVDMGPTSNLFAAGHRIRIDIAGSSFPRLEVNPEKGKNVVWYGGSRPSWLEVR